MLAVCSDVNLGLQLDFWGIFEERDPLKFYKVIKKANEPQNL